MGLQETVADGQLLVASLIALAAGLVSFLSPCVLPLIPGYLAYVGGVAGSTSTAGADPKRAARSERRRMVLGALLFVLGFTVVFLLVNIAAGSLGFWLWDEQEVITRVMGAVVIVMGLVFMGAFGGLQRTRRLRLSPRVGLIGAPLLGVVFAVGWAPCIGPTLGMVLTLSAQSGSVARAVALAILYCFGLGLPFVLAAFGFGWMTTAIAFFKKHIRAVNIVGGGLMILIGVLMVSGIWSRIVFALQAVIGSYVPVL